MKNKHFCRAKPSYADARAQEKRLIWIRKQGFMLLLFLCPNDSHLIVCPKSGRIMFLTFAGKKWNVKERLEYN